MKIENKKIAHLDITQFFNKEAGLISEVQEYAIGGKYEVQCFKLIPGKGYTMADKKLFHSVAGALRAGQEYCEG